jgi:hypothetical protein
MRWAFVGAVLCALPVAAAAPSSPSAFGPGERATYSLRYLGLAAARMSLEVGQPEQALGTYTWPLRCDTRTEWLFRIYPIDDQFTTWWDPVAARTVAHEFRADEGHKRRSQQVTFLHRGGKALVRQQAEGAELREKELPITAGAHDIASAAFALRNAPLELGRTIEFPVFTGEKSFTLAATVVGRLTLSTPLGQREVFQLNVATDFSGKVKAKRLTRVYLTTDPAHVPVRIEADLALGTVEAEIVEYHPGEGSIAELASVARERKRAQ